MQFRFREVESLPVLAWCARVPREGLTVDVFHGQGVETGPAGFAEAAWNGDLTWPALAAAEIVAGTGAVAEAAHIRFISGTDKLSPLFSIVKGGQHFVSNSLVFVLTMADEELDPIYPFYFNDVIRFWRAGLFCPNGLLRLKSWNSAAMHFTTCLRIGANGEFRCEPHPQGQEPNDYDSYKRILLDGVRSVFGNAASSKRRKPGFRPIAALSRGYDTSATAALSAQAGCREAISFYDSRSPYPNADNGCENARALGMTCAAFDRWGYESASARTTASLAFCSVGSVIPLAALKETLPHRILVGAHYGDSVWEPSSSRCCSGLTQPWATVASGLSQLEFRLRTGYLIFAPTFIAARHNAAIHQIAKSEEMQPWTLGGHYDRPLPRRIAEEAGIPRDQFGSSKTGTMHVYLTRADRFPKEGLTAYRAFVGRAHASVPLARRLFWFALAGLRQFGWLLKGGGRMRYVPTSPLQRRFPFLLNASPPRIPWPFTFTLQWLSAELADSYSLGDETSGAAPK